MSTYDSLHRQCRTLESLFDTKLVAYTRLAASLANTTQGDIEASGSAQRWKDVELEVEELLEKVRVFQREARNAGRRKATLARRGE
jgi:golgi SNAP receptor complex member 1